VQPQKNPTSKCKNPLPKITCVVLLLLTSGVAFADLNEEPITVNVKQVERTDGDRDKRGAWLTITAVMESKDVTFDVRCEEFHPHKTQSSRTLCFPIAAGHTYSGKRLGSSIVLWSQDPMDDPNSTSAGYFIVREKETNVSAKDEKGDSK
jgi:hypothetical protein